MRDRCRRRRSTRRAGLRRVGSTPIIAQGAEAGGHRGIFLSDDIASQPGTMALVPQVVDAVRVPVIAAGGIGDARGIAAALMLGAAGVQIGTAYLLTPESTISPIYRAALKGAREDQTVLTNVFTGRPARGIVNRIVREVGPMSADAPAFPLAHRSDVSAARRKRRLPGRATSRRCGRGRRRDLRARCRRGILRGSLRMRRWRCLQTMRDAVTYQERYDRRAGRVERVRARLRGRGRGARVAGDLPARADAQLGGLRGGRAADCGVGAAGVGVRCARARAVGSRSDARAVCGAGLFGGRRARDERAGRRAGGVRRHVDGRADHDARRDDGAGAHCGGGAERHRARGEDERAIADCDLCRQDAAARRVGRVDRAGEGDARRCFPDADDAFWETMARRIGPRVAGRARSRSTTIRRSRTSSSSLRLRRRPI